VMNYQATQKPGTADRNEYYALDAATGGRTGDCTDSSTGRGPGISDGTRMTHLGPLLLGRFQYEHWNHHSPLVAIRHISNHITPRGHRSMMPTTTTLSTDCDIVVHYDDVHHEGVK
jgi:hypothetical protein